MRRGAPVWSTAELEAISPSAVVRYLTKHKWLLKHVAGDDLATLWTRETMGDGPSRPLLGHTWVFAANISDYADRLDMTIADIALTEGKSRVEVFIELAGYRR
jgi:hypothetical protein